MILVGSQRGGSGALARHLLNDRDNDHVQVVELRGFISTDLPGALSEIAAVASATQCRQFLFSLSLNPPKNGGASMEDMLTATDRAEQVLGLTGQPRAVVCHEKEGRRHIHAVWSRIDVTEMKAIPMAFSHNRLMALAKELYLEHGWALPDGFKENGWKNPLNFSLAEWQQAKRLDLDPREIKQLFRETWTQSDGLKSFKAALEERGYFLARGDRRGFVAVDIHGEVHAVARQIGIKTKELEQRFGPPDKLPGVDQVRAELERRLRGGLRRHLSDHRDQQATPLAALKADYAAIVGRQRLERKALERRQLLRKLAENIERQSRLRRGILGLWDILTGRAAAIRRENDLEAFQGERRDRSELHALFKAQMEERRNLHGRIVALRHEHRQERMVLARQVGRLLTLTPPSSTQDRPRQRGRGPSGLSL